MPQNGFAGRGKKLPPRNLNQALYACQIPDRQGQQKRVGSSLGVAIGARQAPAARRGEEKGVIPTCCHRRASQSRSSKALRRNS
jgi:hypothetical protein